MDAPKYGCDENTITKDDDSIVSEKCWQENHRGDSRKWLMRDGSTKTSNAGLMSTMKATYPYPVQEERECVGKRRAIILKELYEEATEEIIRERNAPPPVEKYCTEYDGNYGSNIEIKKNELEEEMNKKLYEKYPLYTSSAMSYWNYQIEKFQRGNASFPGLTTSVDLKNPFRRYSRFTKPLSEVLDE